MINLDQLKPGTHIYFSGKNYIFIKKEDGQYYFIKRELLKATSFLLPNSLETIYESFLAEDGRILYQEDGTPIHSKLEWGVLVHVSKKN